MMATRDGSAGASLLEVGLYLIQQQQGQTPEAIYGAAAPNVVLVVDIDNFIVSNVNQPASVQDAIRAQALHAIHQAVAPRSDNYLVVPFDLDAFAVLMRLEGDDPALETQAVEVANAIVAKCRHECSHSVAVGVSQPHPEPDGLFTAFQEAVAALRHKLVLGGNRVLVSRELSTMARLQKAAKTLEPEHPLWKKLRRGDGADVAPVLQRWLQQSLYATHASPAALDSGVADMLLYSLQVVTESGLPPLYNHAVNRMVEELRTLSSVHEFSYLMLRLEAYFRELIALVAGTDALANDAVTRARLIIQERFSTDISLGSVAQDVYVSPFHLSHLFRRILGVTFLEYLTDFRLQQARVYLEETRDPIAAVATRVGYVDPRHFSKLFKKRLGVTPSQYRQRLLSRL